MSADDRTNPKQGTHMQHPQLNDDELDELDDLLLSRLMPEYAMDITMLDGFFAALVLHTQPVVPEDYLRWVWDSERGEDPPGFASRQDAERAFELIMRHYRSVSEAIREDTYEPLFYVLPQDDGSDFYDAEGWSCGFILATSLFTEPWDTLFEERPDLVAPMELLGTERGWEMLEQSGDEKRVTQEAYESIADAVALIYEHLREPRRTAMPDETEKHGFRTTPVRDVACPCGSGLSFPNCCGAPRTLH
jgi:uncharacterized protein